MVGGSDPEESSGTSRTRQEKTREPSSKIEVSGKEEKAMLSRSSRLIPRGGYKNSRSGPSSRSKLTHPTESTQRCILSRFRPGVLLGFGVVALGAAPSLDVERPEKAALLPIDAGRDVGLEVDGVLEYEGVLTVP